jgi:hypothetical protein
MENLSISKGKFTFKTHQYLFSKFEDNEGNLIDYIILSDKQALIGTDKGILLFSCEDTTVSKIKFDTIEAWVEKLYSKN